MYAAGVRVFVEAGPGPGADPAGRQDPRRPPAPRRRHPTRRASTASAASCWPLAELATAGVPVDTDALFDGRADVRRPRARCRARRRAGRSTATSSATARRHVGARLARSPPTQLPAAPGGGPRAAGAGSASADGAVLEYLRRHARAGRRRARRHARATSARHRRRRPHRSRSVDAATAAERPAAADPGRDRRRSTGEAARGAAVADAGAICWPSCWTLVRDRTGYPTDMLDPDLDLEADLSHRLDQAHRDHRRAGRAPRPAGHRRPARASTTPWSRSWPSSRRCAASWPGSTTRRAERPTRRPTWSRARADQPGRPTPERPRPDAPAADRPLRGRRRRPRSRRPPRGHASTAAASWSSPTSASALADGRGRPPRGARRPRRGPAAAAGRRPLHRRRLDALASADGSIHLGSGHADTRHDARRSSRRARATPLLGGTSRLVAVTGERRPLRAPVNGEAGDPAAPRRAARARAAHEDARRRVPRRPRPRRRRRPRHGHRHPRARRRPASSASCSTPAGRSRSAGTARHRVSSALVARAALAGDRPPARSPSDPTRWCSSPAAPAASPPRSRWPSPPSPAAALELVGRSPLPGPEDPRTARRADRPRCAAPCWSWASCARPPRSRPSARGCSPTARSAPRSPTLAAARRRRSTTTRSTSATPQALGELIDDIYERHGRLDGVVHGAGVLDDRFIRDKTAEGFDRVFATKVDAARHPPRPRAATTPASWSSSAA